METRLRTLPTYTPEEMYNRLVELGAKDPDGKPGFLKDFVYEIYRLGIALTINPDLAVIQAALETGDKERGLPPFVSKVYIERGNIGGIGVTDTHDYGYSFATGTIMARAFMAHLYVYVYGAEDVHPAIAPYVLLDPRWDAVVDKGWDGTVETIHDLTGKWATDPEYGEKIESRYGQIIGSVVPSVVGNIVEIITRIITEHLAGGEGDEGSDDVAEEQWYILSMGHRNANWGGAYRESSWTPWATRALKAEINKRGGKALIIQEEKGTGEYFNGGLQAAARACVDLAKQRGVTFKAYISMHYDSSPGYHSIFPDGANDTKAMNPLDVQLARVIRDKVRATKTVGMKSWTADSPGVMSEKETGVGAQGYRLGEFVGTLGFRSTTARLILEASGVGDDRFIHSENWVKNVYVPAIVDGLEAVFGKMSTGQPPKDPPVPLPEPPKYAQPDPIEEVAELPAFHRLGNGAMLIWVGYSVKAVRDTPRLRHAHKDSPSIGGDIKAGEVFAVNYLIINPDQSMYYLTPWNTRVKFEDVAPLFADVDADVA